MCCSDCKRHTGIECRLTIDTTYLPEPHHAARFDKDEPHYCLEFKPRAPRSQLVRCADCRNIAYHGGPPESLSCVNDLIVTIQSVRRAERQCALFASRHKETTP